MTGRPDRPATRTVSSFRRERASPRTSNPTPTFPLEAGTETKTRFFKASADARRGGVLRLLNRDLRSVVGNAHRAEFRAAHRAEARVLVALFRKRLVVLRLRGLRVERQAELLVPVE